MLHVPFPFRSRSRAVWTIHPGWYREQDWYNRKQWVQVPVSDQCEHLYILSIESLYFSRSHAVWIDHNGSITPAIYSTIAIMGSNRWVIGCTVLSWHIHTCDWSNYCDYNFDYNGSLNRLLNRKSWINYKCDWTIWVHLHLWLVELLRLRYSSVDWIGIAITKMGTELFFELDNTKKSLPS